MEKHVVPTIKEKIELYTLARQIITKDTKFCSRGICDALFDVQIKLNLLVTNENGRTTVKWSRASEDRTPNADSLQSNFPELLARKPDLVPSGWFWWEIGSRKGTNIRLKVIDEILAELSTKL